MSAVGKTLTASPFSILLCGDRRAKAVMDFERTADDELGFRKHDVIMIISQVRFCVPINAFSAVWEYCGPKLRQEQLHETYFILFYFIYKYKFFLKF